MRKYYFLFLSILGICTILSAQRKIDFKNVDTYISESLEYIKADKNITKNEIAKAENIYTQYAKYWGIFSSALQEQILEISNTAVKNKISVYPQILAFVESQNLFLNLQGVSANYENWLNSAQDLLNNKKNKQFSQFYAATTLLLAEQCLYKSTSATWTVSNLDFNFENQSFIFLSLDLIGRAYKDSSCIRQTQGAYYPLEEKFKGQNGKLYWERIGLKEEDIYAEFTNYEINIKNARYSIDSVYLYRSDYFKRSVLGNLEEKLSASSQLTESSYPQFTSYQNDLYLPQVFPNVDIQGVFVQKGAHFYFGAKEQEATLFFIKDQNLLAKVQAETFIVKDNRIISPLARWVLYLDNDSMQHQSSEIRFDQKKRELSIFHSAALNQKIPFIDTYHQVDIYCETIYWQIDSATIDFGLLRIPDRKGKVYLKSKDIYSEQEHQRIAGVSSVNPLYLLRKASETYKSNTIAIKSLAQFAGIDDIMLRTLLLEFASEGFIIYDIKRDEVILQSKLFHYLSVSAKKEDYDVLNIESETEDLINARLNFNTLDLQVYGVKKMLLSEKQNVYIFPKSERITLKKNRDFAFDGFLHCGSFDFYTQGSYFNYADFKIDIQVVDTLSFFVSNINAAGEEERHQISTRLEEFSGNLFIDSAINKGGLQNFPNYPIFTSTQPSYAFYDKPSIYGGAYSRDSFYFKVHSFRLERLNNFSTDGIHFKGEFKSGGIIPDLSESLVVMPDYSLGFTKKTPLEGYPLYNGKARFFDTLSLSNAGFIGKGRLEYLSSESKSSEFLIKPKEMRCIADEFKVKEQIGTISYPLIYAIKVRQFWQIDSNIYHVYSPKQAMQLYEDSLQLIGNYHFSPFISQAEGIIEFKNSAQMQSRKFQLNVKDFSADTSAFSIATLDKNNLFVQTEGYRAKVDMNLKKANFVSNAINSKVVFPLNMYQSYMTNMDWDISKNELFMSVNGTADQNFSTLLKLPLQQRIDLPTVGVDFVSLHPRQDSLRFNATKAIYRTKDSVLEINEVPYIASADAFVFPYLGCVNIGVRAKIEDLDNASLMLASNLHPYIIYNSTVDIQSRNKFKAEGYYDYKSPDLAVQAIFFADIKQNSEGNTFANATIEGDSTQLLLNDGFEFRGKVSLRTQDSLMFFAGSSQLRYSCDNEENENQLRFQAYIDPNNVQIPMNAQSKNSQGKLLGTGFYAQSAGAPFFAFVTPVRSSDRPILSQEGFLSFNKVKKSYTISDSSGNKALNYQIANCFASATGPIEPYIETDNFAMQFYGTISEDQKEQNVLFQSVFSVDYFFDDELQKQIAETFAKNTDLEEAEMNIPHYVSYLSSVLSKKEVQKCTQELKTYGTLTQIPDGIQKSISFSNVLFRWNPLRNAYISAGKVHIASIGKTPINKQVRGYIQLSKNKKGDVVDIYIEASRYEWYYFNYTNGLLQLISSKSEFNDVLNLIKHTKRKKANLEYTLSTQRKKNDFVSKMQNFGLEEAVDMEVEEDVEQGDIEEEEEFIEEEELIEEEEFIEEE